MTVPVKVGNPNAGAGAAETQTEGTSVSPVVQNKQGKRIVAQLQSAPGRQRIRAFNQGTHEI